MWTPAPLLLGEAQVLIYMMEVSVQHPGSMCEGCVWLQYRLSQHQQVPSPSYLCHRWLCTRSRARGARKTWAVALH